MDKYIVVLSWFLDNDNQIYVENNVLGGNYASIFRRK